MSRDVWDGVVPACAVENGADCWVGHTTTADPASSGAKQSGSRVGVPETDDRQRDCEETHHHRRGDEHVAEAPDPDLLSQRGRAGRSHRRDDLDTFLRDDAFPFPVRHRSRDLHLRMIRIIQADATGNALQLFSPRVARHEVPADVLQEAGHLAEQVLRGRDVEEVRLGGVEITHRPFPKGAVARQMQVPLRVQRRNTRGLSGRLDVGADAVNQAGAGPLRVVRDHPRAEGLQLLRAGEGPFAPRRRHRPSNTRFGIPFAEARRGVLGQPKVAAEPVSTSAGVLGLLVG